MGVLDTEKIERLRKKLGLSQEEAAKKAGMATKQQWYNVVKGGRTNIELATLEGIAVALECKAKDLLK